MKRVQMILEEWQHQWLAHEAKRRGVSMSALLRELISQGIEARQTQEMNDDPLWGIIGMAAGPKDGVTSETLDQIIYRLPNDPLPMVADEQKNDY